MKFTIESKTHGTFDILYSKEDEVIIQGHTWSIQKRRNKFYVATSIKGPDGKHRLKSLHSMIAGTPEGMETDHINGDTLDNRRQNLRVCTNSENQMNRGKPKNNTSGLKGVSFHKSTKKYQAYIYRDGRQIHLGVFDILEEAGRVRDAATIELRNVVTPRMLNFPDEFNFVEKRFKEDLKEIR